YRRDTWRVKFNALPERAFAVLNHRIATTSSGKATRDQARDVLEPLAHKFNFTFVAFGDQISDNDAPRLTLSAPHKLEPAPMTPTKGTEFKPYQILSGAIKATYDAHRSLSGDNIAVGPGMPTGNIGASLRLQISLLCAPIRSSQHWKKYKSVGWAHTVNEFSADSFLEIIRFFATLILNLDESIDF
ncbi:hypothetical protein MPER_13209, partial [Moniliophthora perniciosa FA553]